MTTREKIFSGAEALFHEKGFNGVSMREIADRAGISVGNLTYYYPRKEQLVEAIFTARGGRMHTPERLETREDFEAFFRHLLGVQRRTAFYFDSYIQLSQTSEFFHATQCRRMEELRAVFRQGLDALAAQGVIPPERYAGAFEDRVETILTTLMLRLPGKERRGAPPEEDEAVLRRLMALLEG